MSEVNLEIEALKKEIVMLANAASDKAFSDNYSHEFGLDKPAYLIDKGNLDLIYRPAFENCLSKLHALGGTLQC
ncbi:MAG: hypothetical protein GY928_06495 [Colwellia sp.]|nr:hypothetical protein [Colwellia sp.]